MASIGEQIITARKAKGMTQDELSREMNTSRSAISQWERDRRMPDAQTLLKLSAVLDYSFEEGVVKSCEAAPPSGKAAPSADEANANALQADRVDDSRRLAKPAQKRRWILLCAAAAVALCAALWLIPALKGRTQTVAPTSAAVDAGTVTKDFFRQDNVNHPEQPFLNIDSTLTTQKNDGMNMWLYTLSFHEMNGYPFSIDKLEVYTFVRDKVHPVEITREVIAAQDLATDIPAHGDWSFNGGLPIQDAVSGIGFVLRGSDETGAALSFVFWQPLASK